MKSFFSVTRVIIWLKIAVRGETTSTEDLQKQKRLNTIK